MGLQPYSDFSGNSRQGGDAPSKQDTKLATGTMKPVQHFYCDVHLCVLFEKLSVDRPYSKPFYPSSSCF
jgi:hypothetical protein